MVTVFKLKPMRLIEVLHVSAQKKNRLYWFHNKKLDLFGL